jgi:hypothetical protein
MAESMTHSFSEWGNDTDNEANTTLREKVINDVFLNQRLNNSELNDTEDEFQTKLNKKRKAENTHAQMNCRDTATQQTNQDQNKRILIIKGKNDNIVDKNELKLKKFFLQADSSMTVNNIKLHNNYITIAVQTPEQLDKIKSIKTILESEVVVEEKPPNKADTQTKLIIFGVPLSWTDEDIKAESEAEEIFRLQKYNPELNIKEATTTVVLTYQATNTPNQIYIGLKGFKPKLYIPKPQRCQNCQIYGHAAKFCKSKTTCARCSGNHKTETCPIPKFQPTGHSSTGENLQQFKCKNCNGPHASGYQGCEAYIKAKIVTEIKTTNKLSYSEALKKYNNTTTSIPNNQNPNYNRHNTLFPPLVRTIQRQSQSSSRSSVSSLQSTDQHHAVSTATNTVPNFNIQATSATSTPIRRRTSSLSNAHLNLNNSLLHQQQPHDTDIISSLISILSLLIKLLQHSKSCNFPINGLLQSLHALIHTQINNGD